MIILDTTSKSLEVVLSGAITTNQLVYNTSWVDITSSAFTPGSADGVTNNTTAVTTVAAPASSTYRQVKALTVYNKDTVATTVIVQVNDSSTVRILLRVTIQVNESLTYFDSVGWKVLDINGNVKATTVAPTHAITLACDGSGSALTTGTKNPIKIPYGGTLTGWLLEGTPSGSVTVDIFRSADGGGLPVTSIIGGSGTKPALSSATENSSTSFTSWTSTVLTAKDNLAMSLSGVSTTTYAALTLYFS
jgi:hypothetical protein